MVTKKHPPQTDASQFAHNMAEAADKCQEIMREFMSRQTHDLGHKQIDPFNISNAFTELLGRLVSDPGKMMENQMSLMEEYGKLWQASTQKFMGDENKPYIEADSRDRRFRDETWKDNTVFDFIKQSYLLTARWMQTTVRDVEGLDTHTKRKLDFYTRQFVDAMSPSNFAMTNPEVIKTTLESHGENLVKGLKNMLGDLERGKISMTDFNAFKVGKNLAVTKGKVIFQNDLMQLIQYEPTTKQVHKTPVLIVPAWINKFYILDLQPENSFVKWLVDQGYTVFIVSWVNPDKKTSKKTFDDYMFEGPLAALDAIEKATGEKETSVIGYCLGGTLLSITLAWLTAKKQQKRIKSATYLTTMVDFSEAGELSVFIDEEQLNMLETRMSERGFMEGNEMGMTFNMLRANDLIWSFVVNNYLLGKDPFPFDLLYWNADSTRMPALMHSFYLRNMYQKNLLAKPKGIKIGGVAIDLTTIATPSYLLSARDDHIAPWQSTYAATQIYKGDIRFVLAASGHVAGVVNAPSKSKYNHWVGEATHGKHMPKSPDAWLKKAREEAGSWWIDWDSWQQKFAGKKVEARKPGGKLKAIEAAPGSYVKVMS